MPLPSNLPLPSPSQFPVYNRLPTFATLNVHMNCLEKAHQFVLIFVRMIDLISPRPVIDWDLKEIIFIWPKKKRKKCYIQIISIVILHYYSLYACVYSQANRILPNIRRHIQWARILLIILQKAQHNQSQIFKWSDSLLWTIKGLSKCQINFSLDLNILGKKSLHLGIFKSKTIICKDRSKTKRLSQIFYLFCNRSRKK